MVSEAVERLVRELSKRVPDVAWSPEAAIALRLADRIDTSTSAMALNVGQLLTAIENLRGLAPGDVKESPLDEIRARRDARVARETDTADSGAPKRSRKPS